MSAVSSLSTSTRQPRDLRGVDEQLVAPSADVAALADQPAGMSYRRAAGRLGTALWDVFPGHVALVDRDGVVVSVNRAWREFGLAHGGAAPSGLGMNYLQVCDRAAEAGEPEAADAAALVRAALVGATDERHLTYPVQAPGGQRWFSL